MPRLVDIHERPPVFFEEGRRVEAGEREGLGICTLGTSDEYHMPYWASVSLSKK